MVYAMISIGILGFIVWSYIQMALFFIKIIYFYEEVINFAICQNSSTLLSTLYSKNLNNTTSGGIALVSYYTQPAGNLNNTGPLETTRETSFNFDLFFSKYQSDISYNWLVWFIGFTEGDGYIGAYNNRLTFVITQKENIILKQIQKKLNMGSICLTKNNIYRFTVNNESDILKLAYIFNGNFILRHRITQLYLWFSILDQKGLKIPEFNNKPLYPSLKNAWLSGFTDAEGCFNVQIYNRKDTNILSKRVIKRFILDQNNFYNEFIHISNLFDSGFISLRPKTSHQFRLTITSYKALNRVITYFTNYPLKTQKIYNYNLWKECVNQVDNKEHLTSEGLNKIKKLKKQINLFNSLNKKIGLSLKDKDIVRSKS